LPITVSGTALLELKMNYDAVIGLLLNYICMLNADGITYDCKVSKTEPGTHYKFMPCSHFMGQSQTNLLSGSRVIENLTC